MLRLDSSEMLPGSQKGEETAQILSTAIVVVALATRGSLAMIAFTKGNETGRDATRRASLPCARVKTVKHSKLHIRFSDAHLNTKTVDGYSGYDHFALILQNNPHYQLGRSVSYGFDRRTTNQPVFFAKSHV